MTESLLPELSQARHCFLSVQAAFPGQRNAENLPMFRFRGASMLRRTDAKAPHNLVIQIAHG
jgi:hypothetical protein